tara:strand:- start:234 stop:395 length:162 start_codon:yes stop_codon:yes gene_type:complete
MLLLTFFILLLELFTHWIFEPTNFLLTNIFEGKILPWLALFIFIFLFSGKKID